LKTPFWYRGSRVRALTAAIAVALMALNLAIGFEPHRTSPPMTTANTIVLR
jgi:hypothetical protein